MRLMLLVAALVAVNGDGLLPAQEFMLFETENELASNIYGWDVFSGAYPGPHSSNLGSTVGTLSVLPAGGLISSTGNLYAFFTFPVYTIAIENLDQSQPFVSIVVQVATTEVIDATRFNLPPDEFEFLGERASLDFEGDSIPINFYWAEWSGMPATNEFEVDMIGTLEHVSFCGARVSYFNTAQPLDVTFGGSSLLGDVNCDGSVNLLDVGPFVDLISSGDYLDKADMNQDGQIDLLDVGPFVEALAG